MVPRKPPVGGAQAQGGLNQQDEHGPILPPPAASINGPYGKVVDIRHAANAISCKPVLEIVQRRMLRDWLRGVRPRHLRMVYGKPKGLLVDEVDDIVRGQANQAIEEARRENSELRRFLQERKAA